MITNDIIFQLKEGFGLKTFDERFKECSGRAERMYDIKLTLGRYETGDTKRESDEEIFEKKIYPKMSEEERKLFRTYIIAELSEKESQNIFEELEKDSEKQQDAIIEYVQHSFVYEVNYSPQASKEISEEVTSWGINYMKCEEAWTEARSAGDDVIVAVIDGGVDYKHKYIEKNMWKWVENGEIVHGYNFIKKNWYPQDEKGHGTHCAGIIAAENINGIRVSVVPKAKIMALKISGERESSPLESNQSDTPLCAQAIWFAAYYDARVLSNSWSRTEGANEEADKALLDAIHYAYCLKGCVIVFAAGNTPEDGKDITNYFPAKYSQLITVAGTNEANLRIRDSNWGTGITVAAPGQNIWSLKANSVDKFVRDSGTSMAAPHVAGLAALLLGIYPRLPADDVKEHIVASGLDLPRPAGYLPLGRGKRAQALCCVRQALGKPSGNCLN